MSCSGAADGFILVETVTGGKPPYICSRSTAGPLRPAAVFQPQRRGLPLAIRMPTVAKSRCRPPWLNLRN
ncbi:MAG: SprB repeat-containing protein [Saprospirales bacterium]|nr:SprB repeat-containing protein [Saprospirales bacterium]